jgi:O-antigen/teichoic acid export membrane protein
LSSTVTTSDTPARNPLPEGTLAVAGGLIISGAAAYGFLAISKHALGGADSEDSLSLTLLWFLTFILAPGFFMPVEQEVGRALAHRRALGQGTLPVVRRAAALGFGLAGVLLVVVGALSPVLVSQLFHGNWFLMAGLMMAIAGYSMAHFSRGVLSGSDEFGRYGQLLALDGLIRVIPCAALSVFGVKALGAYGLLVGLPPALATVTAVRGKRHLLLDGPEASWNELTPNLGWLLMGSVLSAALVNSGPLAAKILAKTGQSTLVNHFSAGVIISRVPLFMFQAVQAALLPKLAKLAATGAYDEFRAGFRKLLFVVLGVAVLGIAAAPIGGPIALKVFGGELSRRDLVLLAAGSGVYMMAMAVSQALIALHGHAKVAFGWSIGMVMFIGTAALGSDLTLRVELALLAAPIAALAFFGWALRSALARGVQPDADSLRDALAELPLEP